MSRQGAPERFGPEDAARDLAVVFAGTTAAFNLWKKRFDTFVLPVGEPKATASIGVEAQQNGLVSPIDCASRPYSLSSCRSYALEGKTWVGSARYARMASRMIAVFDS